MLNSQEITALTAQAASVANVYPSRDDAGNLLPGWQININGVDVYVGDEIATRGVGVYGQSVENLILTGYLKPATLDLIVTPNLTATVLNNPAVWTGQFGIESLEDYLDSPMLQNISQLALLAGSYQGLLDSGYITGNESSKVQATLVQPSVKFGVTAVIDWIEGRTSSELSADIEITARQGQYAIDFIATYGEQLSQAVDLPGFTDTVLRDEIDFVVEEIIGNPKIPPLEFADVEAVIQSTTAAIADSINQFNNLVRTAPFPDVPLATDEDGRFRFSPGTR